MSFIDYNLIIKERMSTVDLINYVQAFIKINKRYPTKGYSKEETIIVNRICTQKHNNRFSTDELELLNDLYCKYGKKGDWLNPTQLLTSLRKFIEENNFYPDTTYRSGIWGNKLCKRVSAALRHSRFTPEEEDEVLYYQSEYLKRCLTSEQIFNVLKQFIEKDSKYPSQKGDEIERKLACRINAKLSTGDFSNDQYWQIIQWKSILLNKPLPVNTIINMLETYISNHHRLPIKNGNDEEKYLYQQYKYVFYRKLTIIQLNQLNFIKENYGLREYKLDTNKLIKDLYDFIKINHHYPCVVKKSSSLSEQKLCHKVQSALRRNNFSINQLKEIQFLKVNYNNTFLNYRILYDKTIQFLKQYNRLPSLNLKHEKSLRLRINYAYKSKCFTACELKKINLLKTKYNMNRTIIRPYEIVDYLQNHINKSGYYPRENGTIEERKICCSIRYYDKIGSLSQLDIDTILDLQNTFALKPSKSYLSYKVEQILNKLLVSYVCDRKVYGAEINNNAKKVYFRFDYIINLNNERKTIDLIKAIKEPININNNSIVIIEVDGIQHFQPCYFGSNYSAELKFGSRENAKKICFMKQQKYDLAKTLFCETHNIPLLRIKYNQEQLVESMVKDLISYPKKYLNIHYITDN